MGNRLSSLLVSACVLVLVYAEPVTWFSPVEGDVYHPGDSLLAKWHSIHNMTVNSFSLCTAYGMESDGVEDDECGAPVSPVIYQSNSTYSAWLTLSNVSQASPVYLQLQDYDGQLTASSVFTLQPPPHSISARLDPLARELPETRLNPLVNQDNSSATMPGPDSSNGNSGYVIPLASFIATAPLGCALIVFVYGRLKAKHSNRSRTNAPHTGLHEKGLETDSNSIKEASDFAPQYLFLAPPSPAASQESSSNSIHNMRRTTHEPFQSQTPSHCRSAEAHPVSTLRMPRSILVHPPPEAPHSSTYSHTRFRGGPEEIETDAYAQTYAHAPRSFKTRGSVPAALFKAPSPSPSYIHLQDAPTPDLNCVHIPTAPSPAVQAPSSPVMNPFVDERPNSSQSSSSRPARSRRSTASSRKKRTDFTPTVSAVSSASSTSNSSSRPVSSRAHYTRADQATPPPSTPTSSSRPGSLRSSRPTKPPSSGSHMSSHSASPGTGSGFSGTPRASRIPHPSSSRIRDSPAPSPVVYRPTSSALSSSSSMSPRRTLNPSTQLGTSTGPENPSPARASASPRRNESPERILDPELAHRGVNSSPVEEAEQ